MNDDEEYEESVRVFQRMPLRIIDSFHGTEPSGNEQQFFSIPVFVPREQRERGLVDLSSWEPLEKQVRYLLNVAPIIGSIKLSISVGGTPCGVICDEVTRAGVVADLLTLGAQALRAAARVEARVDARHEVARVLPPLSMSAAQAWRVRSRLAGERVRLERGSDWREDPTGRGVPLTPPKELSHWKKCPSYQVSHEISRNGKMDSIATFEKNFAKFAGPRHARTRPRWGRACLPRPSEVLTRM